ncbi:efflux RND transporter periplasmic adaptor subunit [Novosphingobium sp. 1949]|uniref:Efflux RND transporter periplasmic adaptor subunit n=1 Tax=Novosphingobium organovorum TaxID=2930092 RepID=A0ABT0BCP0_9SPHN|nr:efflux RND transporter periplasmic adaptor subunit [Novosphingobium organovorum]MCJ2182845.1 efflux RND transporter periplasmic adaptor subunit [Novosphingobium organovorum]
MNYTNKLDRAQDADAADVAAIAGDAPVGVSMRVVWGAVAATFIVMIAIWFYLHAGQGAQESEKDAAQVPVVTFVKPGRSSVEGTVMATGTLAARRAMPVGSVGEGGEVRRVLVEPGDWVKAGQVLAVVDNSVQIQQQASQAGQVQAAQANARLAQANLDRALQLVDRGFISKADIDQLTATRDSALAQVEIARATLRQLKAQAARLNIVAPAAGLVLQRSVEAGQVVGGGSSVLFRIAKDGEMELLANLSEDDLARVTVGAEAQVTPVGSNESFTGHIWQIAPVIDQTSRQGTARIALAFNPALRPGGFASATLDSGMVVAPMLPESAIQNDDKGSYVYVIDKNNRVQRQPVKTGLVTAKGIVITQGLSGNERVVLRAGGFLNPNDPVKPKRVDDGQA